MRCSFSVSVAVALPLNVTLFIIVTTFAVEHKWPGRGKRHTAIKPGCMDLLCKQDQHHLQTGLCLSASLVWVKRILACSVTYLISAARRALPNLIDSTITIGLQRRTAHQPAEHIEYERERSAKILFDDFGVSPHERCGAGNIKQTRRR